MDQFRMNSLRNYLLQQNMQDLARLVDTGTNPETIGVLLLQRLLQEDQIYQELLIRMEEMDEAARAAYEQILQIKEQQILMHPAYQFFNRLLIQNNPAAEAVDDCGCNSPSGQADSSQSAGFRDDMQTRVESNLDIKASNTSDTTTAGNTKFLRSSKAAGYVNTRKNKRR